MKELSNLKAAVADHEDVVSESASQYAALVMFDFSKRKVNRIDSVMYATLEGDYIDDAFDHFLATDESEGMNEDDKECMIIICEDWL